MKKSGQDYDRSLILDEKPYFLRKRGKLRIN